MQVSYSSTFLLTILLAIGLAFFLRAASKDRTTIVDVSSPLPPIEVLNGISIWLEERGWERDGGDADLQVLRFNGNVSSSKILAVFLSLLCSLGGGSLGLVICQIFPQLFWWPLLLFGLGPLAGLFYQKRAARSEAFELKLLDSSKQYATMLRLKAHRDELISIEADLGETLKLVSDASLVSSPI